MSSQYFDSKRNDLPIENVLEKTGSYGGYLIIKYQVTRLNTANQL
jgi:hypothetical protein